MANEGKIKIDKFDSHDLRFWKMHIEDYLYQKKLHKPLADSKPTDVKMKEGASLADHVNEFNSTYRASKDKEVNMVAGDSDDTLVSYVENMIEAQIMDSGASFHATHCKEELDMFRICSSKLRLAYDKILDISTVRDIVLETSFGKN
ncbi:hypothetical protein Tco_0542501 [Tanacetum coccineum]